MTRAASAIGAVPGTTSPISTSPRGPIPARPTPPQSRSAGRMPSGALEPERIAKASFSRCSRVVGPAGRAFSLSATCISSDSTCASGVPVVSRGLLAPRPLPRALVLRGRAEGDRLHRLARHEPAREHPARRLGGAALVRGLHVRVVGVGGPKADAHGLARHRCRGGVGGRAGRSVVPKRHEEEAEIDVVLDPRLCGIAHREAVLPDPRVERPRIGSRESERHEASDALLRQHDHRGLRLAPAASLNGAAPATDLQAVRVLEAILRPERVERRLRGKDLRRGWRRNDEPEGLTRPIEARLADEVLDARLLVPEDEHLLDREERERRRELPLARRRGERTARRGVAHRGEGSRDHQHDDDEGTEDLRHSAAAVSGCIAAAPT